MTTFITINAQGLRSDDRRHNAFSFFRRNRLDIILLQETHWTSELETKIKSEWNGDAFFSSGTNNSRGVAILISSRLDYNVIRVSSDNDGRVLNIILDLEERTLNILNIYAPNTDNERRVFFSNLDDFISEEYDNVIGGDFNCILNARLDKYGGNTEFRNSAGSTLQGICTKYDLLDIWRNRHKDKRCYTWSGRHSTNGSIIRTRIDKFLTSNSLSQFVTDTLIKPFPHSDHDCVYLTFNFEQVNRGPGYWHFNNDLLSDAAFESQISDFWSSWKAKYDDYDDPLLWWDRAKNQFKIIAIRYAKLLGKQKRHERLQLERSLIKLQQRSNNGNTKNIENYLLVKEKLKQLELKELEAIKIKTKARFLEEGERSTRYFYSLDKSRQADQTIHTLTKENLDTISEPQDLLKETYSFYKTLFTAEGCDESVRNQFLNCDIPRLPEEACESCEGIITEEELSNAVKAMENNKSPGFDGLTTSTTSTTSFFPSPSWRPDAFCYAPVFFTF